MKLLKPKTDNRLNEFFLFLFKVARERNLTCNTQYKGEGLIFVDSSASNREIVFKGKTKWTGNDMTYVVECDRVIKEGYDAALPWGDMLDGLITHITFELDRLIEKANAEDLEKATLSPIMPEEEVDYSKNIHDYHDLLFATRQFAQKNDIQFALKSDGHNDTFFRFEKRYPAVDENDPLAIRSKVISIDIANDKQFEGCENLDDVYNKLIVILKDQCHLYENSSEPANKCCCASKMSADEEKKVCYEAFRNMFINGAIDKIHAEAPCIPYEWVVEFCYKEEFIDLCDQASKCVRIFCEHIKDKLRENENKEES